MEKPRLPDRVHSVARLRYLSWGNEKAYASWIRRYSLFHRKRHLSEMGAEVIRQWVRK